MSECYNRECPFRGQSANLSEGCPCAELCNRFTAEDYKITYSDRTEPNRMPLPEPPEDNMTIEKAIDLLETYDFDYSPGMTQAAYMGSAALRIQQEVARSNPLTLDELREMDAPVWCLCKPIEGGNGYWCLCQNGHITTPAGTQYYVDELPHWIFLRRKPEEG